jgi:hypothetical protein
MALAAIAPPREWPNIRGPARDRRELELVVRPDQIASARVQLVQLLADVVPDHAVHYVRGVHRHGVGRLERGVRTEVQSFLPVLAFSAVSWP